MGVARDHLAASHGSSELVASHPCWESKVGHPHSAMSSSLKGSEALTHVWVSPGSAREGLHRACLERRLRQLATSHLHPRGENQSTETRSAEVHGECPCGGRAGLMLCCEHCGWTPEPRQGEVTRKHNSQALHPVWFLPGPSAQLWELYQLLSLLPETLDPPLPRLPSCAQLPHLCRASCSGRKWSHHRATLPAAFLTPGLPRV